MDSKIQKLIEISGFEEDPQWNILKQLFEDVSFSDYQKVLERRDVVIRNLLKKEEDELYRGWRSKEKSPILHTDDDISRWELFTHSEQGNLYVDRPLLFSGGYINIPGCDVKLGSGPIFLDKGVTLSHCIIAAPCYIAEGATIEYSCVQDGHKQKYNYIGPNVMISNVSEFRGCFVSGGPVRGAGGTETYLHARSLNNVIVGAYSRIAVGADTYNHSLPGQKSKMIDPETLESVEISAEKLPVLLGLEAVVGPQSLLHSGSVIGAKAIVPSRADVEGLVLLKEGNLLYYDAGSPGKKLQP